MIAARLHAYGGALQLDSIAEPEVEGPEDVIVAIGAAGLCRTDLHIVEGQWASRSEVALPYTLGHENAGWVRAVGDAVDTVSVGDTVIVHPLATCGHCAACRAGNDMHCENSAFPGIDSDGGFAELLKTNQRALVKLPEDSDPIAVAALADAGLTAYHAVKKVAAQVDATSKVLVIGAGGLGHIGVQLLRSMCDAEVVVVDPSEVARRLAVDAGAHRAFGIESSDLGRVEDLTDGQGVDAVVDFVGERGATSMGVGLLRRAGSYYVIGYGEDLQVPTIDIISREINFIGNLVGTYRDLVELMQLVTRREVQVETVRYPLEAVADAMADLDAGRIRGRGVLTAAGRD